MALKLDQIYSLYNQTFATKKDNDKSFYAFRKMMHEMGFIDDELYIKLAIDDDDRSQNESRQYEYYYFINEGDIPEFDDFKENNFGFKSEIIRILARINHVIITDEQGTEISYNKLEGRNGLPYWEKVSDKGTITEVDAPELTSILCNYIIDMQYNYKVNDDYLNVNVAKIDQDSEEISDVIKYLESWYRTIFDTEEIDDEQWRKFIPFVEEAGIIDNMTKSRILADSTATTF